VFVLENKTEKDTPVRSLKAYDFCTASILATWIYAISSSSDNGVNSIDSLGSLTARMVAVVLGDAFVRIGTSSSSSTSSDPLHKHVFPLDIDVRCCRRRRRS
jgi:hypothetical protein